MAKHKNQYFISAGLNKTYDSTLINWIEDIVNRVDATGRPMNNRSELVKRALYYLMETHGEGVTPARYNPDHIATLIENQSAMIASMMEAITKLANYGIVRHVTTEDGVNRYEVDDKMLSSLPTGILTGGSGRIE